MDIEKFAKSLRWNETLSEWVYVVDGKTMRAKDVVKLLLKEIVKVKDERNEWRKAYRAASGSDLNHPGDDD